MAEQRQAKAVRNKDIALLQEVKMVQMDIVSLEQRADWEKARMEKITQHIGVSGGGGGSPHGMDDAFASLAETEQRHRNLCKQYTKIVRKAERIIGSISSHKMRTMVTMLYMENVAASAVQSVLHMSRWTFDNARAAIENADSMADVKWNKRYETDS